jgi:hypothetical protein
MCSKFFHFHQERIGGIQVREHILVIGSAPGFFHHVLRVREAMSAKTFEAAKPRAAGAGKSSMMMLR